MNEPFNIDEDGMFYDVPPTPPHTLTDERAGYDAPSEAEASPVKISTEQLLRWATGAMTVDPRLGRQNKIARLDKRTAAAILELAEERDQARWEVFKAREETAQAVAAREAEIVALKEEVLRLEYVSDVVIDALNAYHKHPTRYQENPKYAHFRTNKTEV